MNRVRWSDKDRAKIFLAGDGRCYLCNMKLDRGWEAEHMTALCMGGEDVLENIRPVCLPCHRAKSKQDVANLYRAIRRQNRHKGIHRPKSIMSGSRLSRWRKKLNGEVVLR